MSNDIALSCTTALRYLRDAGVHPDAVHDVLATVRVAALWAEAYLPGDHDAQARLIAAAPNLLAVLEASPQLVCHHDYHNSACWPCAARAAIAKAKGEQS